MLPAFVPTSLATYWCQSFVRESPDRIERMDMDMIHIGDCERSSLMEIDQSVWNTNCWKFGRSLAGESYEVRENESFSRAGQECKKVKVEEGRGKNAGWNSLCFAHLCLLLQLPKWSTYPTHQMLATSLLWTFLTNMNVMDENVTMWQSHSLGCQRILSSKSIVSHLRTYKSDMKGVHYQKHCRCQRWKIHLLFISYILRCRSYQLKNPLLTSFKIKSDLE